MQALREHRNDLLLWFGFFAGPGAWFLHLMVSYILGAHLCEADATWALHAATVAALALAGAGLGASAVRWRGLERPGHAPESHQRFLALGGIGMGAFFGVIILLAGLINLVLDPCERG